MQLNCVICITDRDKTAGMENLFESVGIGIRLSMLASGTASSEQLSLHNLSPTEKVVITAFAPPDSIKQLFKLAKRKMYIDIPGNGIMMSVPVKSIGGGKTLAYISENGAPAAGVPDMNFTHELIAVVVNEGYSDQVMQAAREAGAGGGSVIHAKGTGASAARKFFSMTLTNEKDLVLIVEEVKKKQAIMRAITEKAGVTTDAGAICFTLPVSSVVGLRMSEEE